MVRCINCLVAIPATQRYQYNAICMGPEIVSVLETWIDRQVIDEEFLCQKCVNLLILEAYNSIEGNIGKRQYGHQSVCISCGMSIARKNAKRARVINRGDPMWSYFAEAIEPLEIPSNARVCMSCWLRAHRQRPSKCPQAPTSKILSISAGRETDYSVSDAEIKTDTENNNLDVELDDKHDVTERDDTTDNSALLKVRKRKTKEVKNSKQKGRGSTKINKRQPIFLSKTLFDITGTEQHTTIKKSWNYKKALYRCVVCFKGYLDEDTYNSHMQKHSKTSNLLKERRRHIEEKRFKCESCDKSFDMRYRLNKHVKIVHERTTYPCDLCGKHYSSEYGRQRHIACAHTARKQFQCESCGKSFGEKYRLLEHLQRVHGDDKTTHPCSVCGKHYSTEYKRRLHMIVHSDLKPFKCDFCDKTFKRNSEKKSHISHIHLKTPLRKKCKVERGERQVRGSTTSHRSPPAPKTPKGPKPLGARKIPRTSEDPKPPIARKIPRIPKDPKPPLARKIPRTTEDP